MGDRISKVITNLEGNTQLKKILLISPHFPPSNLTAVHRARFFANHLPENGWEPVILTVHEKYYEEEPDHNLEKLLPGKLRIEKANAFKLTRPRIIGDIGLRAFFQLYKKAKRLITQENFDFLYIMIPSFYCALLGRWLHESTGIKYGIDYIDPWVHEFPGSEKMFSRAWFATKVSKVLEPVAVKKSSLITGVAASYFEDVIKRNHMKRQYRKFIAIPYGSEKSDHEAVDNLKLEPYLFKKEPGKIKLVYAGAMLPKAYALLEQICIAVAGHKEIFKNVEFHFIGTGKTVNDPNGYNVKPLAVKYGIWEKEIFEYPKRIPYLDVLVHLNAADGVFILGSTEPHYTPSKVYQAVLSEKLILAVLHKESTGVKVVRDANAGLVLDFNGEEQVKEIAGSFADSFRKYLQWLPDFDPAQTNKEIFEQYSARHITRSLARLLDELSDTK